MFIGSNLDYIGSNEWYIGSWQITVDLDSGAASLDQSPESKWIFTNEKNQVLTSINFGSVAPGDTVTQKIKFRYRGHRPIILLGFYLKQMPKNLYLGQKHPVADAAELIRWADQYTQEAAVPPGLPGLEISCINAENDLVETIQLKSGRGDSKESVAPYLGKINGIMSLDSIGEIDIRITVPLDSSNQITESLKLHFSLEMEAVEIPENLESLLNG